MQTIETKGFFKFEIIIMHFLISSFASLENLCYGATWSTAIISFLNIFGAGIVFRRQILTSKDDSRTERVKHVCYSH